MYRHDIVVRVLRLEILKYATSGPVRYMRKWSAVYLYSTQDICGVHIVDPAQTQEVRLLCRGIRKGWDSRMGGAQLY